MAQIHPSSIVDASAVLAEDVVVGPYCIVGPHVRMGAGCRMISHATVTGHTTLGKNNTIWQGAVIGSPPQDLKWRGEPTRLEVGDNNQLRENVTMHVGTIQDKVSGGVTRVGSNNLIMVGVHVGHDCQVGSNVIIANECMLAGHVHIGDRAVIMGGVGVSHFVSVGEYAYIAGMARIRMDIPPFVKVQEDGRMVALNKTGLRRAGYPEAAIAELELAVRKLVKRGRPVAATIRMFHLDNGVHPDVRKLVQFIERRSEVKSGRYLESLRHR
jgi:UDP-N-acetylglucosamine acyltransferase